jgi:tetratricopeptide (TPR) repeat protein
MSKLTFESLLPTARAALAHGNGDQAKHFFLQALTLNRESADAHDGLARAYFMLNDRDSAAYHFREATRLDPRRPAAFINLGAVLNALDEREEALRALEEGIRLAPGSADGHYHLGQVYRSAGMIEQAMNAYWQALTLNPKLADAHHHLGNLHTQREEYEDAIEHYRAALELQPGWQQCARSLQAAELSLATRDTAVHEPQSAATLDPEQRLDPTRHETALETLHAAVKQAQSEGNKLLQLLERELEPTLAELTHALVGREECSVSELGRPVHKYEHAIESFQKTYEELLRWVERSQELGVRLLRTATGTETAPVESR